MQDCQMKNWSTEQLSGGSQLGYVLFSCFLRLMSYIRGGSQPGVDELQGHAKSSRGYAKSSRGARIIV